MEQTLLTDQDNALVFADEGAAHRSWFQRSPSASNDDLEAAGFPRCPRRLHGAQLARDALRVAPALPGGSTRRSPQALLEAAIFFDYRPRRRRARPDPARTRWCAGPAEAAASSASSPGRRWSSAPPARPDAPAARGDVAMVDLKLQGISPVVFLARCYGLEAGTRRGTRWSGSTRRARRAPRRGGRATVSEAYRFVLGPPAAPPAAGRSRRGRRRPTRSPSPQLTRSSGPGSRTPSAQSASWQDRGTFPLQAGSSSDGCQRSRPGLDAPAASPRQGRGASVHVPALGLGRLLVARSGDGWASTPAEDAMLGAVGMVPIREGTIRLGQAWCTLVGPRLRRRMDPDSVKAHRLVWGEVREAPPVCEVLPEDQSAAS